MENAAYSKAYRTILAIKNTDGWEVLKSLSGGTWRSVKDIFLELRTDQSRVSLALGKMFRAGILEMRESGKENYYRLDNSVFNRFLAIRHLAVLTEKKKRWTK
jgi:DNA-binding transcriptional ArsR family regulator